MEDRLDIESSMLMQKDCMHVALLKFEGAENVNEYFEVE